MEICIYTLACVCACEYIYIYVRGSARSRGRTIMTLLQELRVSSGNPASEDSAHSPFFVLNLASTRSVFRKEAVDRSEKGRRRRGE